MTIPTSARKWKCFTCDAVYFSLQGSYFPFRAWESHIQVDVLSLYGGLWTSEIILAVSYSHQWTMMNLEAWYALKSLSK